MESVMNNKALIAAVAALVVAVAAVLGVDLDQEALVAAIAVLAGAAGAIGGALMARNAAKKAAPAGGGDEVVRQPLVLPAQTAQSEEYDEDDWIGLAEAVADLSERVTRLEVNGGAGAVRVDTLNDEWPGAAGAAGSLE